jgi:hypothetical protein
MAKETSKWKKEALELSEKLSARAIAKLWQRQHKRAIAHHSTVSRWLKASKGA